MVNTMKKALAIVCLSLLLLAACGSKAPAPEPAQPEPATPVVTQPATPSADTTIQDLDQSVTAVDTLQSDFDESGLDQIDADLAAIDNLELG